MDIESLKLTLITYGIAIPVHMAIYVPFSLLIGFAIARSKGQPLKPTLKKAAILGLVFSLGKAIHVVDKEMSKYKQAQGKYGEAVNTSVWNKYEAFEIVIDLPTELKKSLATKETLPENVKNLIKSFDSYEAEYGELTIRATRMEYKNGVSLDIDAAASGSVRNMASDEDVKSEHKIEKINVSGYEARSIKFQRSKLIVRTTLVKVNSVFWQVQVAFFETTGVSDQAERVLASLVVNSQAK